MHPNLTPPGQRASVPQIEAEAQQPDLSSTQRTPRPNRRVVYSSHSIFGKKLAVADGIWKFSGSRGGFLPGYDFTSRVRGALIKAREEAHRRHHEYVGTEHLLIGLLEEEDALVMDVLDNLGVQPYALQTSIERVVQNGQPSSRDRMPDLPYTSRARVVLDQAIAVAHEFGDGYVGTQHLLLGLIRERQGIAAQALAAAGLTEASLRREIVRLLQGEGVAAALDVDTADAFEETQIPLSIAVEVRYEDGTLAKKIFTTPTEAIGFLREKAAVRD